MRTLMFSAVAVTAWTTNSCTPRRSIGLAESSHDDFLEKANQLRHEAQELEASLGDNRKVENATPNVQYTSLEDSVWRITYRFTSEPVEDDRDTPVENLGGEVVVQLLANGYTEILSQKYFGSNNHKITKCWGWDLEHSTQDEEDYLLFSMDVELPENGQERFYLQARQQLEDSSVIQLDDGSVTVKKDVVPPSANGFFGFLSPRGILAQFRLVGGFTAKPHKEYKDMSSI